MTDIQAGQGESSSELGRSSLVLGALGVLEEKVKASGEMPAFLRASFVARLENILRIGCWLCLVGVDVGSWSGISRAGAIHRVKQSKREISPSLECIKG